MSNVKTEKRNGVIRVDTKLEIRDVRAKRDGQQSHGKIRELCKESGKK